MGTPLTLADIDEARRTPGRAALIFLTDRCPVGCAHCSVDSRPDGPRVTDLEALATYVEGVVADPGVELVGITGGEPFTERRALPATVGQIIDAGRRVVVYTSGVWAVPAGVPSWIRSLLPRIDAVVLGVDLFHVDRLGGGRFVAALRCLAESGTPVVIQVIDDGHTPALVTAAVEGIRAEHPGVRIELKLTPLLPFGRAAEQATPLPGAGAGQACGLVHSPTVRYGGEVLACCNEQLVMGAGPARLRRQAATAAEVAGAMAEFRHDPVLRAIGAVGPVALLALPELAGLRERSRKDLCGTCWAINDHVATNGMPAALAALGTNHRMEIA
jgi:pyruvate-formate lyase-activating enzyme